MKNFKHPEQSRDVVLGRAPSRHLGVPVLGGLKGV